MGPPLHSLFPCPPLCRGRALSAILSHSTPALHMVADTKPNSNSILLGQVHVNSLNSR